ncbi:helix-turn-helix domain-containing protein [Chloroflexota bacterium]
MTPIDDWLTSTEAAEISGYHVERIRELLREEKIKGRKWGQAWMISRDSLMSYVHKIEKQGARRGPKPKI